MLRGLYTAAAGLISEQRKHDTATNNIANISTPGFKRGVTVSRSFPDILISRMNSGKNEPSAVPIGRLNTGVLAEENIPVFLQGDLQETGSSFDFAIVSDIQVPGAEFDASGKSVAPDGQTTYQPQAFFTVLDENGGQHYTRDGKFTVNSQLELVNSEGYRVADRNGRPIVLRNPATNAPLDKLKLNPDGTFAMPDGQALLDAAGQPVGLRLSRVENPHRLIAEGNGLYRINPGDAASVTSIAADNQVQLHQGYIERSNVDAAQTMVDMNTALRAYEANQKVIQFYDKSLDKAVNEVGRV